MVRNSKGLENGDKVSSGENDFYVVETGHRQHETGNANKKSGLQPTDDSVVNFRFLGNTADRRFGRIYQNN